MSQYKYTDLKKILLEEIRSGKYQEGSLLDSEAELQNRFAVSRNTVRHTLADLEHAGYISRHRGKGTVIAALRPERSRKIALVLYSIPLMLHPVTAELIRGIDETLSAEGYTLDILAGCRDLSLEKVSSLFQTYAGILVGAAHMDQPLLQKFLHADIPCVFLKNYRDEYREQVWRIDFAAVGRIAAEHLLERGYRDFGVLYAGDELEISREFYEGIRSACLENGAVLRAANVISADETAPEKVSALLAPVLTGPKAPEALICFTDTLASLAVEFCDSAGIAIPGKLAVTGCNDTELARRCHIPLTSFRIPTGRLGRLGSRELLDRIGGKAPGKPALLAPELVVRESSGGKKA